MTATLHHDGTRSVLRFERSLAHPHERVWRAVTEPAELAQWFPAAVIYEPRAGAPMQFDFGGGAGQDVWPGEVLEWDPPRVFAFVWGEDVLRFELSSDGEGTLLVFTHAFAHQPGKPARDAAGWSACFDAFDALLASEPKPEVAARWAAHHERHLASFGDLEVASQVVRLRGPYVEVDGRPAVNVTLDERPGVLVVRDRGQALAGGTAVEVREGDASAPGELMLAGVLRDPLAR
jgi:uncharacterized protein YndB with AHSA1/START domain